ncbi:hypothetical protein F5Y03DRAFT_393106 [Xylaria venustula]|nr:hypothetical protein F5Y03DRAFT_393106 [Xylaria venustula]
MNSSRLVFLFFACSNYAVEKLEWPRKAGTTRPQQKTTLLLGFQYASWYSDIPDFGSIRLRIRFDANEADNGCDRKCNLGRIRPDALSSERVADTRLWVGVRYFERGGSAWVLNLIEDRRFGCVFSLEMR